MSRTHGDCFASPALIGRSKELERLSAALAAARAGKGGVVLISGQAGVGKSRIVAELSTSGDCLLIEGHCYEEDTAFPFVLLADVLQSILALGNDVDVTVLCEARATHLAFLSMDGPQSPQAGTPVAGDDPQAHRRRLFDALAGLFIDLVARRPLLLALEDLHWSDESSLEFVSYLARQLSNHRILAVGTYCPDEAISSLLKLVQQLRGRHQGQEMALHPWGPWSASSLAMPCCNNSRGWIRPHL